MSKWQYMYEMSRYYMLKFGFFMFYLSVKFRSMVGLEVDEMELQDFEMEKLKIEY